MTPSRPHIGLHVLALSGMLLVPSACATNTRPGTAPAAPPAPAAASPAAPAPAFGTAGGVYRPAASAPAPLLGHVTREQVRAYEPWQPLFVEPYVPDAPSVAAIRANAEGLTVLVVVATWCPDSKREVPRFFSIMDRAGIDESQLTMVGVDRTKKDAEGLTGTWGITRVPTFVFLRNGQELGRVVERTPAGAALEGEIARILAAKQ
jgi:thiol-disulfide isomerase/thioredoxin